MKPYPSYKESGIEWIGKVPYDWKYKKFKYIFGYEKGGVPRNLEMEKIGDDYFPYLDTDSLRGNVDGLKYTKMNDNLLLIDENSILLLWDGSKSGEFFRGKKGIISSTMVKLSQIIDIKDNYYFFLLKCFEPFLKSSNTGMGIPHVNGNVLKNSLLVIPPHSEQKQISQFLDRKTHQIDELSEKTERKIKLLKEKRTSFINHCVTIGLNPNVEMKDSGMEWIGKIPKHWGVTRLKFLSFIKYGLGQPPRELEDGLPIIRATNISEGNIIPHDLLYADPNDIPYDRDPILKENDIIVVRSGAYTGDSAIIPKEYEGAVAGYDMVVRVHKAEPQYIAYSLLSHSVLHNQIDLCRLRAAQPHLNAEELGNALIFLPPNPEQQQIIDYLDEQTQKIDTIIDKENQRIELLKEYRQSFISEVVTGKIDVRDEVVV